MTTYPVSERISDAEFLLSVCADVLDLASAALTSDQRKAIEKSEEFYRAGWPTLRKFQKAVEERAASMANDVENVDYLVGVVARDFDEFEPGTENQMTRAVLREVGAL